VLILDLSGLVDDDFSELQYDEIVGWLPAARGLERDQGVDNRSSVGPGQMVLHADGRRLFVTNFNANSISVYDLSLGPYGTLIDEVELVGEAPYAMTLSPDGTYLVFANTLGEADSTSSNATLGVLDVDEDSPTYLEVVTWIANR
jgi:DNA-binding beta-propeller fold protein YncE